MIQLTRLNNSRLALNCDLIKYVEQAPDTVITLLSGEKLLVRETTEQVIERVRDFRRSVLARTEDTSASQSGLGLDRTASHPGPCTEEPDRG